MLFLTIGTLFSFDRLVRAVDEAIGKGEIVEEVFAQIGPGDYKPRNMNWVESLGREEFEEVVARSSGLISHAGIGSINAAVKSGKPMVVFPRLMRYSEHVNDHQVHTAEKFEALGIVLVAYNESQLPERCRSLPGFRPKPRVADTARLVLTLRSEIQGRGGSASR